MNDERLHCIFADKEKTRRGLSCSALSEYFCEFGHCKFFKPRKNWRMTTCGFVHHKDLTRDIYTGVKFEDLKRGEFPVKNT